MRIDIVSIFPGMFSSLEHSLTGKALERSIFDLHVHDLRDHAMGPSHQVDDEPYGGGAGMVLALPPLVAAIDHVKNIGPTGTKPRVLLMSPQGRMLTQPLVEELSRESWLLLLCGRYKGFDERIMETGLVDEEVSIGDYILGGGELPAMVIAESILRLIPGVVMGNRESVDLDSFSARILDYPHYTRPPEYLGIPVPEILLSGDEKAITRWRRREALKRTLKRRPDLLTNADLSDEDLEILHELESG